MQGSMGLSKKSNSRVDINKGLKKLYGLPKPRFLPLFISLILLGIPIWVVVQKRWGEVEVKWIIAYLTTTGFVSAIVWAEGKKVGDIDEIDDFVRILVDKVEAIAILLAATLFIAESPERLTQKDIDIVIEAKNPPDRQRSLERLVKQNMSLAGVDLQAAYFPTIDLEGALFPGANFTSSTLEGANFISAHLDNADFTKAQLRGSLFNKALLKNVDFNDADLREADFSQARLYGAKFINANLEGFHFEEGRIVNRSENTLLREADLRKVDFSNANLARVDFSGASLAGANFSGANLQDIQWNRQTVWDNVQGLDTAENIPLKLINQLKLGKRQNPEQ